MGGAVVGGLVVGGVVCAVVGAVVGAGVGVGLGAGADVAGVEFAFEEPAFEGALVDEGVVPVPEGAVVVTPGEAGEAAPLAGTTNQRFSIPWPLVWPAAVSPE